MSIRERCGAREQERASEDKTGVFARDQQWSEHRRSCPLSENGRPPKAGALLSRLNSTTARVAGGVICAGSARKEERSTYLRTVLRSLGWVLARQLLLENGIAFAGMAQRPDPSQQTKYHSQTGLPSRIPIPANEIPFSNVFFRVASHPSEPNTILKHRAVVPEGDETVSPATARGQTAPPTTASQPDCASGDRFSARLAHVATTRGRFGRLPVAGGTVWRQSCRRRHSLVHRLSSSAQSGAQQQRVEVVPTGVQGLAGRRHGPGLVVGIYHPLTQVPPDCLRKRTPPMCPRVRLRAFAGVCGP